MTIETNIKYLYIRWEHERINLHTGKNGHYHQQKIPLLGNLIICRLICCFAFDRLRT